MATPDLHRLGEHVIGRRLRLNLSVRRAAEAADLSKDTWMRVERGEAVRHVTYDKVETALGWTVGSCRKVMDGGDAVPVDGGDVTPVPAGTLEVEVREAVQGALISATDHLTTAQIREVNERAIDILRARGVLPPKD